MTEATYKVGDILEFATIVPRQFGLRTGPVRGLVIKINNPGYEYLSYRLLVSEPMDGTEDMMIYVVFEKDIVSAAKKIGHIDISGFLNNGENNEPDYVFFFAAATLAQAADLRNELDKIKNENEKLKAENKDLHEKLANERKILEQKIKCAERYFDSAAAALYEGREHLSMTIHSMTDE